MESAYVLFDNLCRATEWIAQKKTSERVAEEYLPIFLDPENTWVDRRMTIGTGTLIFPYCVIMGTKPIGKNCVIYPHTTLINVELGDDVTFGLPHQKEAVVGDKSVIGRLAEFNRVRFGVKSKNAHNSYLGDTVLGDGSNVGAGFVTANYDGEKKHKTAFGPGSFLGVNSCTIAPNEFPEGTQIAAGSTVPQNLKLLRLIPAFSVIISRAKELFIKPRKVRD